MSEYNLHTIRELLGEAFSSGEITTLAFDLFHNVYQDFTAGMTRSQKIEMVVNHANQKGKIPELLAYIQRQNLYQYGRFENQLKSAPVNETAADSSGKISAMSKRRLLREKEQLEAQWKLKSEIVGRLGQALMIETDVTRKFQAEQQLQQAEKELQEIEDKLDAVDNQLKNS